jgi:hypothetical protein
MRFNELDEPKIGDILEVEIGDEIVETVIVGITESGDYLCETDSDAGMALLESRSDWDSNMPGYKGDYGGAENWGRREREDDEHHDVDRQREQQLAQYNQTGKFWLKFKDSGKHINDQPYTGKAAATAAAQMMIRSNPEVKGNLLITAYGPEESQGVTEGMEPEKRARLDDLISMYRDSTDPSDYYDSEYEDPEEVLNMIRAEFGDRVASQVEAGTDKMHFPRKDHDQGYDPMSWRKPIDRQTKAGKMYKQDSDYRKNTIKSRYANSGRSVTSEQGVPEGYTVTRGIDTERYQARDGLEGPFSTKSGKVVYYDKVEGKYYDPDTDMYIDYSDWQAMNEAEYQGRNVPLGKPMQGDVAKSKVYVKNPQGNVVKVNFGDKTMRIKKSNPDRRKNFRARHNCENPGPRHKARYWSCRAW